MASANPLARSSSIVRFICPEVRSKRTRHQSPVSLTHISGLAHALQSRLDIRGRLFEMQIDQSDDRGRGEAGEVERDTQ
jgi:hypothetical protein